MGMIKNLNMNMKLKIFVFCLVLVNFEAKAQDVFFTQFQYAPVNLNPGLTGCGKNNMRLSAVSKMQWFNLYKPYKYVSAALDYSTYDNSLRNIVNLGLTVDHSSKGYLSNTNISGVLGRSFGTDNYDCSNWYLSAAIQAGFTFGSVNPDNFLFIDQIDQTGITGNASQIDLFNTHNSKTYFDMSSGAVLSWNDFMFGLAVHHLNEPNTSFTGKPEDGRLLRKYTGHVSWMYDLGDINVKATAIAQFQGQSSMFTAGALFDFKEFPIELGCWYRNNTSFSYNNAFSVGFSWKWGEATTVTSMKKEYSNRLGISYDAEINKPGLKTTFGSMEFGVQRDIIIGDGSSCPSSTSGVCSYRFPWEFF
jgi:type IX secretion system PorP/SprF family membrane protein